MSSPTAAYLHFLIATFLHFITGADSYYTYLVDEREQKTFQMLADEENVDLSTIYKDHKAALQQLSALFFGYFE